MSELALTPAEELRALRLEVAELRQEATNFGLNYQARTDPLELEITTRGVGLAFVRDRIGTPGPNAHLLIEGDNLLALRALRDVYHAKVDLIYIDPPYNTGNTKRSGFTYSDRFRNPKDAERHSSWLSMLAVRLELARSLLSPTGTILISIDDHEVHHLRLLCDEIFGEHNFVAQMVWDGGNIKNNARFISTTHEYVLVYARSLAALGDASVTWREPRPGTELLVSKYESLLALYPGDFARITAELKEWVKSAPLSKRLKVFTGVDARGLYTYADLSAPGSVGIRYDVLHPVTAKPAQVPSRGWGTTPERMAELIADDRILFGVDETTQPMRKLYLSDKTDQVRRSILPYPARSSTHLLQHMLGERRAFSNPKNLDMLRDLISLIAPPDALVLDFFAGSGTTGHAVLELNSRDEGTRRFILVTNNENKILDNVTYPRLRAAITGQWATGQHRALGGSLVGLRAELLPQDSDPAIAQLAGLVYLSTGVMPTMKAHTCQAQGEVAAFAWDGAGRRSEVQKRLIKFIASLPKRTPVVLVGSPVTALDYGSTRNAVSYLSTH
jgi:DNA modification methylase